MYQVNKIQEFNTKCFVRQRENTPDPLHSLRPYSDVIIPRKSILSTLCVF